MVKGTKNNKFGKVKASITCAVILILLLASLLLLPYELFFVSASIGSVLLSRIEKKLNQSPPQLIRERNCDMVRVSGQLSHMEQGDEHADAH